MVVESSRGGKADDSAALVADVTAIVHSSFALCHSQVSYSYRHTHTYIYAYIRKAPILLTLSVCLFLSW